MKHRIVILTRSEHSLNRLDMGTIIAEIPVALREMSSESSPHEPEGQRAGRLTGDLTNSLNIE